MTSYGVKETVAHLHSKLGDLCGDWMIRLESLVPISSAEIEAVDKSAGTSWPYAIKVIESQRARVVSRRASKIKTRDGEEITETERELRRAMFESTSDGISLVLASIGFDRGSLRTMSDLDKERLTRELREQQQRDKLDDEERDRLAAQRGERNKQKLQQLLKGEI